jgi:hypothetical protein
MCIRVYLLVISLVYWSLWSGSFLGVYGVMNSCMYPHLIGLLSYGIWRIPMLSCRWSIELCRGCCVSDNCRLCFPIHFINVCFLCRSQWPRGLRHELSSPAQTLGSWIRIPLETWLSVCVYSVCLGSGLATG